MFLIARMMTLWPIRVDLGIGPARMICVTSKVLSARSVDRPTAVDIEEIAVASGLKFIGLLGRKLAAFVFDNESSLLDRRCRKKTQPVRERPMRKALLLAISGDRMPVILAPSDYAHWLGEEPDPRDVMRPFPADLMRMWPISTRVNKPENDDPSIVEPIQLSTDAA